MERNQPEHLKMDRKELAKTKPGEKCKMCVCVASFVLGRRTLSQLHRTWHFSIQKLGSSLRLNCYFMTTFNKNQQVYIKCKCLWRRPSVSRTKVRIGVCRQSLTPSRSLHRTAHTDTFIHNERTKGKINIAFSSLNGFFGSIIRIQCLHPMC